MKRMPRISRDIHHRFFSPNNRPAVFSWCLPKYSIPSFAPAGLGEISRKPREERRGRGQWLFVVNHLPRWGTSAFLVLPARRFICRMLRRPVAARRRDRINRSVHPAFRTAIGDPGRFSPHAEIKRERKHRSQGARRSARIPAATSFH